jgi:NTP pyrophosphatase (non-canonical NTP hydrolase)
MDMEKIQSIIKEFSTQRDWEKFHNPKNLAMALSVEASELVEIFQWLTLEQSENLSEDKKEHAREEIADIAVYLIRICMHFDIDLEKAIIDKMKKNEKKYPLFDEDGVKIEYGKKK